jgi:hypothetical protein
MKAGVLVILAGLAGLCADAGGRIEGFLGSAVVVGSCASIAVLAVLADRLVVDFADDELRARDLRGSPP